VILLKRYNGIAWLEQKYIAVSKTNFCAFLERNCIRVLTAEAFVAYWLSAIDSQILMQEGETTK
jgi:hypothetical protein